MDGKSEGMQLEDTGWMRSKPRATQSGGSQNTRESGAVVANLVFTDSELAIE